MPLDPQAQTLLDQAAASGLPPVYTLPVAQARARMLAAFAPSGEPEPVGRIENLTISVADDVDIPLRIYYPDEAEVPGILLFLHGGGWVLNNIDTHDGICRNLTRSSGYVTVSVDFRLAPEHPFPTAIEDCLAALEWTVNSAADLGSAGDRVVIAGDSSGGNLATVVAQIAFDRGISLAGQVLIYPVTDYLVPGTKSYQEFATGYSLNREFMEWFWQHYLPADADPYQASVSPLRSQDVSHLPPTLLLTAEFDPLRDEGEAYARRLQEAGVATQLSRYDGMMHGFLIQYSRLDKGRSALNEIAAWLRSLVA